MITPLFWTIFDSPDSVHIREVLLYYAYEWTASTTGTGTVAFKLRNDPSDWYLDDVSVYDRTIQILVNGGFESGSLSP